MDCWLVAVVEPHSWEAEVGPGTMNEAQHITIEGNRGIQVLGSDVHMMNVHGPPMLALTHLDAVGADIRALTIPPRTRQERVGLLCRRYLLVFQMSVASFQLSPSFCQITTYLPT